MKLPESLYSVVYAIVIDKDCFIEDCTYEKEECSTEQVDNLNLMKRARILIGDTVYDNHAKALAVQDRMNISGSYLVTVRFYGTGNIGFIRKYNVTMEETVVKKETLAGSNVSDSVIVRHSHKLTIPILAIDAGLKTVNKYSPTHGFILGNNEVFDSIDTESKESKFQKIKLERSKGQSVYFGYAYILVNNVVEKTINFKTIPVPIMLENELAPVFKTEEAAHIFMKDRGLWFCVPHLIRFIDL